MAKVLSDSEFKKLTTKRIVKALKESGLQRKELAEIMDVSVSCMNGLFNGKMPRAYVLYRLAKALDIQLAYLCEGSIECDDGFEDLLLRVVDKNEQKGLITPTVADTMRGMIREARIEIDSKK